MGKCLHEGYHLIMISIEPKYDSDGQSSLEVKNQTFPQLFFDGYFRVVKLAHFLLKKILLLISINEA